MKEELNYLSRMLTRVEEHVIDLELLRDKPHECKGVAYHYQVRIDHANKGIENINSIIDYITRKELSI